MATEEEILSLFETYWSEISILTNISPLKPQSSTNPSLQIQQEIQEAKFSSLPTLKVRSFSEQQLLNSITASFSSDSFSPNTVLTLPKLQPILSGKEFTDFSKNRVEQEDLVIEVPKKMKFREKKRGNNSKSLSDLEFEELKGFMDMGFVFTEEADKDSELVSIIPWLQRLKNKNGEDIESEVSRPYLSEAWDVLDQKKKEKPILMDWKLQSLGNETDMKEQLRFWAHTVASTVR